MMSVVNASTVAGKVSYPFGQLIDRYLTDAEQYFRATPDGGLENGFRGCSNGPGACGDCIHFRKPIR